MIQQIELELKGLRELQGRIAEQHLAPDDWKVFAALISNLTDRADAKVSRMIAKILAAEAAAGQDEITNIEDEVLDDARLASDTQRDDEKPSSEALAGDGSDSKPATRGL